MKRSSIALLAVSCLFLSADARSQAAGPFWQRPIEDFYLFDWHVNEWCYPDEPVQKWELFRIKWLWDLTTDYRYLPAGYYLAFKSRFALVNPQPRTPCEFYQHMYNQQVAASDEGELRMWGKFWSSR
jgi:hypothetical protein